MFAANAQSWWAAQIRAGDVVRWPYALAPTAPIDERDIAAVGVRALCDDRCAGAEYVLTGPQSLSQLEQVSIIGDVLGRPLRLEEITPDEWRGELAASVPAPAANMLLKAWAACNRTACVGYDSSRRDHGSAAADVSGVGDGSRGGVPEGAHGNLRLTGQARWSAGRQGARLAYAAVLFLALARKAVKSEIELQRQLQNARVAVGSRDLAEIRTRD